MTFIYFIPLIDERLKLAPSKPLAEKHSYKTEIPLTPDAHLRQIVGYEGALRAKGGGLLVQA